MSENKSMGSRIAELRKKAGLTQEQLSEKLNVSAQAVSKWENNQSMPDVALIPKIAEIFGVTTDDLFGNRPISMPEKKTNTDSGKSYEFHWDTGDTNKIILAIFIIIAGASLFLSKVNVIPWLNDISLWSFVWPLALCGIGISSLCAGFSVYSLGFFAFGVYYLLLNLGIIHFSLTWKLIWPLALVFVGLSILLETLGKKKKFRRIAEKLRPGNHTPVESYSDTDGYINYTCTFSDDNRKFTGKTLAGGNLCVKFADASLDLTALSGVKDGANLLINTEFGDFTLIVPKKVKINLDSRRSFGSDSITGTADENAPYQLFVSANIKFGDFNIEYR